MTKIPLAEYQDVEDRAELLVQRVLEKAVVNGKVFTTKLKEVLLEEGYEALSAMEELVENEQSELALKVWAALPDPDGLMDLIMDLNSSLEDEKAGPKVRNVRDALVNIRDNIDEALAYKGLRKEALSALEEGKAGGLLHETAYLEDYLRELELKAATLRATLDRARTGYDVSDDPAVVGNLGLTELRMWLNDAMRNTLDTASKEMLELILAWQPIEVHMDGEGTCMLCRKRSQIDEGDWNGKPLKSVQHEDNCPYKGVLTFIALREDDALSGEDEEANEEDVDAGTTG